MGKYVDNLDNLMEELLKVVPISYMSSSVFEEKIQTSRYGIQWRTMGIGYIMTEALEGKDVAMEAKIKGMCSIYIREGVPSINKFVSFIISNYCEDNQTHVNLQKLRVILRSIGVVRIEELEQYDSNTPFTQNIVTEDKTCENHEKYKAILNYIYKLCKGYEQDESIYKGKSEEGLRALIVSTLNTVFPDLNSSSETKNRKGKTDIITKTFGNINILIAECKIWDGEKKLSKAIDQLLSYVTWRDKGTSLILFVKKGELKDTIEKAKSTIAKHHCCVKYIGQTLESSFSYIYHINDDPQCPISLELMIFHYPE